MSVLSELDRLDWREFEHLCLVLFERYFNAPDANFYGANNFGQDGIDIRLTTNKAGIPARVVIQCKAVRSLEWSNFSTDLHLALKAFARKTVAEGRTFRFIVATTAEIENTKKFDGNKDDMIQEVGLGEIANCIDFQVYTGARLRVMAEHDPELRKLFFRPERSADLHTTQELTRLEVRLTRHARSNDFASAQRDLDAYLRSAKPPESEKFDWLPTVMFDRVADITLGAGDFERTHRLLNAALGADPLDARYLLGYLRSRRTLHAAPWHNLPRAHIFEQTVALPAPEDDVEDMSAQLLTALGEVDQQLTLALWVTSYAKQLNLAEQGLSRALGLVTQSWPSNLERLKKDGHYVFSDEGYFDRLPMSPMRKRLPASSEHLRACALAIGYTYIRTVHDARFGFESVRRVEEEHDGWPVAIDGVCRPNATTYFSGLQSMCQRALRTYLPSLLAEGGGREFGRDHSSGDKRTFPPSLATRTYVSTPEFLLRDWECGLVGRRINELAHSGFLGTGATILISHLGLERLVQVQLGERIGLNEQRMPHQRPALLAAIAEILHKLRRSEPTGDERFNEPRPPFASRPCYEKFATVESVNSRSASIELARSAQYPFLAISLFELNLAATELASAGQHLLYWDPGIITP
jgi:hypothetical protein